MGRIRRQQHSSACAVAVIVLIAWWSSKDVQLHTFSAGGIQRRGVLQFSVASAVTCGLIQEARAEGPAALSPRTCLVSYESGGCVLSAEIPVAWRKDPNESPMRIAQWELDPSQTTDVIIFYLPLGLGIESQLSRWENEFPANARTSGPTRSGVFDVKKKTPVLVEVAGGWDGGGPAGGNKDKPIKSDQALCGAIVPGAPAGKDERQMAFFVKVVGAERVVRANADLFKRFVSSMQTA